MRKPFKVTSREGPWAVYVTLFRVGSFIFNSLTFLPTLSHALPSGGSLGFSNS